MRKLFSLFAAVLFAGGMMAAEPKVTLDFTEAGWNFPTDYVATAANYTNGDYTVAFSAKGGDGSGHKKITSGETVVSVLFGKKDATLTLPAMSFNVGKIVTYGQESASGKTTFNVFVGSDAVSTEATSCKVAHEFEIAAEKQAAGTVYVIKVTNANNCQFSKIEFYEAAGDTPDPQPVVGDWNQIKFTAAVAADALPEDSIFKSTKEGFEAKIADAGNKMAIDANDCRFGTATDYEMYNFRLKSGGASGSDKNYINVSIPVDGKFGVAPRTGSNSATDRALYIIQNNDTLFNGIIQESQAVEVVENEQTVKVYPYVTVDVKAGNVVVRYNAGMNIYAFGLNTTLSPTPQPTQLDTITCDSAKTAALADKTDSVYVKGYVTEIAYAWANGSMSFWMADAKDGGKVFEAYKCAIEKEEDAVRVGDLVVAKGKLTKYNTTPELAAGCTVTILERGETIEPKNLGEKTIAEFLELKNMVDTCILTGVIDSVVSTTYGNFNIIDATGKVYVYGLLTAAGEAQKCFEEEGLAEGDTLTILALYNEYKGAPQVKNAIFVSLAKKKTELTGDTINVTMSEGLRFYDNVAGAGWWELYGSDDKYVIELSNVETEQIAGVYTIDDLDPDYAYIGIINGEDTTYVNFVDGAITLAVTNDGVTAVGALVGEDGNVYNLNLAYVIPTAKETVNVVIANGESYDEYADYGLYVVYGEDENKVYVQLAIWAENGFEGNFTEEDLDNQYVGSFLYEGEEPVEIYSAAITVTPGNGGDYNITADLLGYNNKLYKVTMYVPAAEGLEGVDASVKAIKTLVNGNVVIEKNNVRYNMNGQVIK